MRTPLPARVAAYLILAAILFDFILYFVSDAEYFYPGIGLFTFLALPIGMLLVIGGYVFMFVEWSDLQKGPSFTSPGFGQIGLQLDPELHGSTKGAGLPYPAPPRFSLWLGIVLFTIGATSFFAINYWMETRSFKPVDMPVSLVPGHIRSGPFKINLTKDYLITLDATDYRSLNWNCIS